MGENEEIVARIQQGETALLETLYADNLGLVKMVANRYISAIAENGQREYMGFEFDDLMQAGYIAIAYAARTYDPAWGCSFATAAYKDLQKEMRYVIGWRGTKIHSLDTAASYDVPAYDDDSCTTAEVLPAPDTTDAPCILQELRKIVRQAVADIEDAPARDAIERRYWEQQDTERMSQALGISRMEVYNRLQRGYAVLRKDKRIIALALAEGLNAEYRPYTGADAYRKKSVRAFNASFTSSVEDIAIAHDEASRQNAALHDLLGDLAAVPNLCERR